jgi:hypothetical protein
MESPGSALAKLQVVEIKCPNCSVLPKELTARDFSAEFHQGVIARFVATQSIKQTARDSRIAARVVNEILHLANLRRPVSRAGATSPLARPQLMRRMA